MHMELNKYIPSATAGSVCNKMYKNPIYHKRGRLR